MDAEFEEIAGRDESHFFDIKESAVSGKAVQKTAAAFSKLNGHLQALFEVKPALEIKYEFLKRETADGYALRILVEKKAHECAPSQMGTYICGKVLNHFL